jgi:hypothetical protein
MSSTTAKMLMEMLEAAEGDCEAIEKVITTDRPDTTDQLLILRTLQQSCRNHCAALRSAIREFD